MIEKFTQAAQLSQAAYARLNPGPTVDSLNQLVDENFTLTQRVEFATNFPVIVTQYADTLDTGGMGTGFNATVFANKDGKLTLAIRGTDSLGIGNETSDLLAGQNIVTNGMAYDQVVAMVNWWNRAATPVGEMVKQFQLLEVFNFQMPAGAVVLHSGTNPDSSYVLAAAPEMAAFSDTRNISAKLGADPVRRIDVAGHSLGGHLGMLFSTIYSSQTAQVTVFNAPGFKDSSVNRAFMLKLGGAIPLAGASNITNVIADETALGAAPFNLLAGMHSKPGAVFDISIENQFNADEPDPPGSLNHSIMMLADSLAIYKLLADLGPVSDLGESSFSRTDYKRILNQMVQGTAGSYERIVDALQKLFVIGETGFLDTGNGKRESLYKAIQGLVQENSGYDLKKGKLQVEAMTGVAGHFVANAQTSDARGFAWRYALNELNPFVVIDAGNTGLYARFQTGESNAGELDIYDAIARTGILTVKWLEDRAALLQRRLDIAANDENNDSSQPPKLSNPTKTWGSDDLYFEDRASGYVLNQGDQRIHRPYVIFGSDNADVIEGSSRADRLYGGGSTDYLIGKGEADYLEGGTGLDIYEYDAARGGLFGLATSPDGNDTVLDVDGKGVLRYLYRDTTGNTQSTVIAGVIFKESDNNWKSADGRFLLTREGDDLKVTFGASIDGSIKIKDFDFAKAAQSGYFGIRLVETQAPPVTANNIFGDYAYLRVNDVVQNDSLGNPLRSADPQAGQDGINVLQDSSVNDRMEGLTQSDWLVARRGGDDHILGGEERDYLEGGEGHDMLEGGADGNAGALGGGQFSNVIGGDVLFGGIGHDWLYGNVRKETADLVRDGESGISGDARGDVLDGGDGNDLLAGDVNGDVLLGGAGDDLLIGGASNDFLLGDAERAFGAVNLAEPQAFAYWGWSITSTVNGASRNDLFHQFTKVEAAAPGRDMIYGGAGHDKVFAGGSDDLVWGGSGEDWLFGDGGSDILIGGADKDILTGDSESTPFEQQGGDYLDGGDGNDELFGYGGNDVLIGGKGLDVLNGGAGKDIYLFNRGDGLEVVVDTINKDKDPEASVVVFGSGVTKTDIVFRTGSFWIDLGPSDRNDPQGERDGLYFPEFDSAKAHTNLPLGEIHFADGTAMDHEAIIAQGFDIDGTAFDDAGSTALIGTSITDRIRGFAGSDELDGRDGDDVLTGDGGTDRLDGGRGNDVLNGGAGRDFLAGGAGGDDYRFIRGDGNDTLVEGSLVVPGLADPGHTDRIVFGEGITREDVSLIRSGDGSLTVGYGAGNDIRIEGQYSVAGSEIERIVFADGQVIDKVELDALETGVLRGSAGNDELFGTPGNDALNGGTGSDTYNLYWGMGSDSILDTVDGEINILMLQDGMTLESVKTTRVGNDLRVTLRGGGGGTTVQGFFTEGGAPAWQIASATEGNKSLLDFYALQSAADNAPVIDAMTDYKQQLLGVWRAGSQPNQALPNQVYVNSTWSQTVSEWTVSIPALPQPVVQTISFVNDPVSHTSIQGYGIRQGNRTVALPVSGNSVFQRLVSPEVLTIESNDAFIEAQGSASLFGESSTYSFFAGGVGPFNNARTYSYRNGFMLNTVTESSNEGWAPLTLRTDTLGDYSFTVHQFTEIPLIEVIHAGASNNAIVGALENDNKHVVLIDADAGDDVISAGQYDFVSGNEGDDEISGGAYAYGGNGYDRLFDGRFMAGGADDDFLSGGVGATTFHFQSDEAGQDFVRDQNGMSLSEFALRAGFSDSPSNLVYGGKYRLDGEASLQFQLALEERAGGISAYRDLLNAQLTYAEIELDNGDIQKYATLDGAVNFPRGVPDPFFRGPYRSDGYDTWVFNSVEDVMRDFADLDMPFNPADVQQIPEVADLSNFTADNHAALQPFFDSGVLERDTVELAGFEVGVDTLQIGFAPVYDEVNRVLRLIWGEDKAIDIDLPSATDLIGHGIEVVRLGQGSMYIGDLIDMAQQQGFLGTPFDDSLRGTAGDDHIRGLAGWDFIEGDAGNDVLSGGQGIDEFFFAPGAGSDIILDPDSEDLILFDAAVTPDLLRLGLGSLRLGYGSAGDEIHFEGFNPDDVYAKALFSALQFYDLNEWSLVSELSYEQVLSNGFDIDGSIGDDFLRGTNINDRFMGGAGNDVLTGGAGSDTYFFNAGDGIDTINDAIGAGEINRVVLGYQSADITGIRQGSYVVLRAGAGDTLRILWNDATGSGVDQIEFFDGIVWDRAVLAQLPVEAGNTPPALVHAIADQAATEGNPFSFAVPIDTFTDPDEGDMLVYGSTRADGSALPAWLSFNPATRTFSGAPGNEDVGSVVVRLMVTDEQGASASDEFLLQVANVNGAPIVSQPLTDAQATEDTAFNYTVPTGSFFDGDAGDSLTLSATQAEGAALPGWLHFNAVSGIFSGTPGNADVGTVALHVTATDREGAAISEEFELIVANTNDAPLLAQVLANQSATENIAFSYTIPAGTFMDIDAGDALIYTASRADGSALPSWLMFNAATLELSGMPPDGAAGELLLGITATDKAGSQALAVFALQIETDTEGVSIFGTSASESLSGTVFDDSIDGRGGNDTLHGLAGNDWLRGGAGADRLIGGSGDDLLDGRRGHDVLKGGKGSDTYLFGKAYGKDVIEDDGLAGEIDTVLFDEGISFRDLRFSKDSGDLTISIAGTGDRLTIRDWSSRKDGIEVLRFANGQMVNLREAVRYGDINADWDHDNHGVNNHHNRRSAERRDKQSSSDRNDDDSELNDLKKEKDFGKLINDWFDKRRHSGDALLSWLEEVRDGSKGVREPDAAIRAVWEASERWMNDHQHADVGRAGNAHNEDFSALPWLNHQAVEAKSGLAIKGLPALGGHGLESFKGLEEGLRILG